MDLEARANDIIARTSQPQEPKHEAVRPVPEDAATDDNPVMAGVAKQFNGSTEDIDLSTLPEVKDLKKMLPSQRMSMFARVSEVAKALPENTSEGEASLEVVAPMAEAFEKMENFVLTMAKDPEAMTDWIINQDQPELALSAAFEHLAGELGN